ncbi:MAG: hypothetical protein ACKOBO_07910 [Acidimicrobiales bacterium]
MAAGGFMVVAITTREARVWDIGVGPGSVPHVILSDDPHREQRQVPPSQDDHMHHRRIDDPSFYAAVARLVTGAMSSNLEAMTDGEILAAAREWWTRHVAVT